jgi:hypothetical protein
MRLWAHLTFFALGLKLAGVRGQEPPMPDENFPPLSKPLDVIAANLAHEGVPVQAIARALARSFDEVYETLQYFIDVGGITVMPVSDWPPSSKRGDRLPAWIAKEAEAVQIFTVQRALKLTRLMASFMLVLLKRDDADKETLHYVIETQRSLRRSRPENPEMTDPKMVDVVVCNLRKRLRPFGVTVKTLWGYGYYIDEDDRAKVEQLLKAISTPSPETDNAAG